MRKFKRFNVATLGWPSNKWLEPTAQSELASLALWVPSLRSAAAQPRR